MENDSYRNNEEFDYGYAQHFSNDESEEENDGEGDIVKDGEGDIDKDGVEVGKILMNLVLETCKQFDMFKWLMYIYHWLNWPYSDMY